MSIVVIGSEGFIGRHFCSKYDCVGMDRKTNNVDYKKIRGKLVVFLGGGYNYKDKLDYYRDIVDFAYFFKMANRYKPKRIVYASSACVYEKLTPYSISKMACEYIASISGINCVGLRMFNVYGKGQNPKMIISQLLNKHSVKIFNINDKRDYIHVDDVCTEINKQLFSKTNGVIDVKTGKKTSLKRLIKEVNNLGIHPHILLTDGLKKCL